MDIVKNFLIKNGLKECGDNCYINELCSVMILNNHYEVKNEEGSTIYSTDLNIYWLIGVLTYYNYIPKNYKQ
jgi:hypothetical protein